jgi:hypothetical protein
MNRALVIVAVAASMALSTGCAVNGDGGAPAAGHGTGATAADPVPLSDRDHEAARETADAVDPAVLSGAEPMSDRQLHAILGTEPVAEAVRAFSPAVIANEHAVSAESVNRVLGYQPSPDALERTRPLRAGLRASLYQLRARFASGAIGAEQHRAARRALWHRYVRGVSRVLGCSREEARRIVLEDRAGHER